MTRNDWERELDQNSRNWQLRAAYGDWLEENGYEVEARCQWWMSKNKKSAWRSHADTGEYLWWNGNRNKPSTDMPFDPESDLPAEVWNVMSWPQYSCKIFSTRIIAEETLATVLEVIRSNTYGKKNILFGMSLPEVVPMAGSVG